LTTRLKELEQAGVVRRRIRPRPERSIVYELTEFGQGLEEAVMSLGRWGAKLLDAPRPGETITPDSMIMAMRTTFRRAAARGVNVGYELRFGEIIINVRVSNGKLAVTEGPLADADLVIEAGPGIKALLAGEVTPAEAIKNGIVRITGNRSELARFVDLFKIEPKPAIAANQ
jgi:DNA-binding MarR family transcriptional regulator